MIGHRFRRALRRDAELLVLLSFCLAACLVFALMPKDWMPEYRFATPVFLLAPLVMVVAADWVARVAALASSTRLQTALGLALVGMATVYSAASSRAFQAAPTAPFQHVRSLSRAISAIASSRGMHRPRVLLPDIGGSLWEDKFEVMDLAGLTDRTIGRSLRHDRDALAAYVVAQEPDLIWVHGYWKELLRLGDLPRFGELYSVWPGEPTFSGPDAVLFIHKTWEPAPGLSSR
jgi:hypothetical protein